MNTTIDDPLLGALVDGRYRIRARVARGGMTTAYTAIDERLGRTVTFKIIHPTQAGDSQFAERFTNEAAVFAQLTHPNVVAVYDQGLHEGLAYLIMEYVRGKSLRELLTERQRLDPQDALSVLEQMLAAIAAAHRGGLVHRDVKPENVLIAGAPSGAESLLDSVVKVTDFGLAQAVEASADHGGHLMATAAYVAPELVAHGHADPRTDVYSAGIVLFEMLTGRVPYQAESIVDVAWMHVQQDVPAPSQLVPGLPPALEDLVTRATSRDPANRPTDAGAMHVQVQTLRDEIGAALAQAHHASQQTTVVPHLTASGADSAPTAMINRILDRPKGERPHWARLPSTRSGPEARSGQEARSGPGVYLAASRRPQPHRRGSPGARNALAPLAARVRIDPKARIAVIAGVIALGLLISFGIWWLGVGRYTTAPSLVNLPKEKAIAQARKAGFSVKLDVDQFDEQVPKGTVLNQHPRAGARIVSGGSITIVLSRGQERYQVPDISGKTFDVAEQDLKLVKLRTKRTEQYDDNVPANTVISTDPLPGTVVKPGTEITVQVSKGRAPISVPNVVGKSRTEAETILREARLTVEVIEQDSTKPKDQVIAQSLPDGSGAEEGTKITLTVSKGPPYVEMPEVRGKSAEEATQILQGLGLQVQVVGGGTVRFQDPLPGSRVQPGSQVRIFAGF